MCWACGRKHVALPHLRERCVDHARGRIAGIGVRGIIVAAAAAVAVAAAVIGIRIAVVPLLFAVGLLGLLTRSLLGGAASFLFGKLLLELAIEPLVIRLLLGDLRLDFGGLLLLLFDKLLLLRLLLGEAASRRC